LFVCLLVGWLVGQLVGWLAGSGRWDTRAVKVNGNVVLIKPKPEKTIKFQKETGLKNL